jgi:hypothetical protein
MQVVGCEAVSALLLTLSGQAWKMWRVRVKHGIGKFFFAGQVASSVLFLTYSAMVGDRIFVVGNALVLAAAVAGGSILWWNKTRR